MAEFIARSPLLRKLELHRSRVDDTRLLMLANALMDHPSLIEISLPYNVLGDDAARILARHIDHTGRRVKVVGLIDHLASPLSFRCGRPNPQVKRRRRRGGVGQGCPSPQKFLKF